MLLNHAGFPDSHHRVNYLCLDEAQECWLNSHLQSVERHPLLENRPLLEIVTD